MVDTAPDYEGIAKRVMRTDLYEEAMKELGVPHGGQTYSSETFFDGLAFDPRQPEAYATGFTVNSVKA